MEEEKIPQTFKPPKTQHKDTKLRSIEEQTEPSQTQSFFTAADEELYHSLKDFSDTWDENKPRLLVCIIPLGIPGAGKSTFYKNLKKVADKAGWTCTTVSSDNIRKDEMDNLMMKQKLSKDAAFSKTAQTAGKAFYAELRRLILEAGKYYAHIIFVDKNHPPNGIKNTARQIQENLREGTQLTTLYLIPEGKEDTLPNYPFSANFFLQCFLRCKRREVHETLDNSDMTKLSSILFMFLKMYNGVEFNKDFLENYNLDGYLKAPLTYENPKIVIPQNIVDEMIAILRTTKMGD